MIWLASDPLAGRTVVASTLTSARVQGMRRAVGLRHPHLATLLDVLDDVPPDQIPGGKPLRRGMAIAVAEHVAGQTQHERLESGRVSVHKAVLWSVKLANGLHVMHSNGGVHGALSPRSIMVARTDQGVVPILTNLRAAANGAYCSPERVRGGGPTAEDDTWALHATLFSALTGSSPYRGSTRDELARAILSGQPPDLRDHDVFDHTLARIIDNGLHADPRARATSVAVLENALVTWLRAHPATESERPSMLPPTVMSDDDGEVFEASVPPSSARSGDDEDDEMETIQLDASGMLEKVVARMPSPLGEPDDPSLGDQVPTTVMSAPLLDVMVGKSLTVRKDPDETDTSIDEAPPGLSPSRPRIESVRGPVLQDVQSWTSDDLEAAGAPIDLDDLERRSDPQQGLATAGLMDELSEADRNASDVLSQPGTPLRDAPYYGYHQPPSQEHWGGEHQPPSQPQEVPPWGGVQAGPPPPVDSPGWPPVQGPPPVLQEAQLVSNGAALAHDDGYGALPAAPAADSAPRRPRTRSRIGWAIGGTLLMIAAAAGSFVVAVTLANDRLPAPIASLFGPPQVPATVPPSASAPDPVVPTASAAPTASAEPTGSDDGAAGSGPTPARTTPPTQEELKVCVESYFPPDTFVREVPFDYLCTNDNPRKAALMLHKELVRGGAGAVTNGMKIWSGLAWYELAVVALLRDGCCGPVPPMALPEAGEACKPLTVALEEVVHGGCTVEEAGKRALAFEGAVQCLFSNNLPRPYRYRGVPRPDQRAAFEDFLRQLPVERCGR